MPTFKAITREIVRKEYEIEAEDFRYAHQEFMLSNIREVGTPLIEETLTWVIESPDGLRVNGYSIEPEEGDPVDLRTIPEDVNANVTMQPAPTGAEYEGLVMWGEPMPAEVDSPILFFDELPKVRRFDRESMDIMLRLYRDAEAGPARHVFEGKSIDMDTFNRLHMAGLVYIQQMPTGVKLELTPAGMEFIKGEIEAATSSLVDDVVGSPPAPAGTPMAFEYYEVRPCIDHDRGTRSFTDMDEFDDAMGEAAASRESFRVFWTLYGMAGEPAPEGTPEPGFHAQAIGDFESRDQAFAVMNAILAPLAFARDAINQAVEDSKTIPLLNRGRMLSNAMGDVANDLDDVINQSSNGERL